MTKYLIATVCSFSTSKALELLEEFQLELEENQLKQVSLLAENRWREEEANRLAKEMIFPIVDWAVVADNRKVIVENTHQFGVLLAQEVRLEDEIWRLSQIIERRRSLGRDFARRTIRIVGSRAA